MTQPTNSRYQVTDEQIDACARWEQNGKAFYTVQSATDGNVYYRVEYNRQFGKLTCNCQAGQEGNGCWHKRAALAAEGEYKTALRIEHEADLAEQARLEATAEYQREVAEQTLAEQARIAERDAQENGSTEAAAREYVAVAQDGLKCYEREPFSLMR